MIEESQFVQKLDLSEPGVFVFHSSTALPLEAIQRVTGEMDAVIQKFSPESRSVFLDGCFSPVTVIKESNPKDRPIKELIKEANGQTKPPSPWRKAFWETMTILGIVVFSIMVGVGLAAIIIKIVLSL